MEGYMALDMLAVLRPEDLILGKIQPSAFMYLIDQKTPPRFPYQWEDSPCYTGTKFEPCIKGFNKYQSPGVKDLCCRDERW